MIYDENGNIIKYIQKPTGKTDEICAKHDIDYELSKNINEKHKADKRMINSINKLLYKDKQWGTFLVKNIINTKQKFWALEVFWGVFQIVILLAFLNPWRSARHFTVSNFSITSNKQFYFKIFFELIL